MVHRQSQAVPLCQLFGGASEAAAVAARLGLIRKLPQDISATPGQFQAGQYNHQHGQTVLPI